MATAKLNTKYVPAKNDWAKVPVGSKVLAHFTGIEYLVLANDAGAMTLTPISGGLLQTKGYNGSEAVVTYTYPAYKNDELYAYPLMQSPPKREGTSVTLELTLGDAGVNGFYSSAILSRDINITFDGEGIELITKRIANAG